MSIFIIVLLIRSLFVLGMICLLVIAGALLTRRGKNRAANLYSDASTNPGQRPAFTQRSLLTQRSLRYPTQRGRAEANDSEASARGDRRRAA